MGAAGLASLDRERVVGTELAEGVRAVDLGGALGLSATGFRFAGIVCGGAGDEIAAADALNAATSRVVRVSAS